MIDTDRVCAFSYNANYEDYQVNSFVRRKNIIYIPRLEIFLSGMRTYLLRDDAIELWQLLKNK